MFCKYPVNPLYPALKRLPFFGFQSSLIADRRGSAIRPAIETLQKVNRSCGRARMATSAADRGFTEYLRCFDLTTLRMFRRKQLRIKLFLPKKRRLLTSFLLHTPLHFGLPCGGARIFCIWMKDSELLLLTFSGLLHALD